MRRREEGEGERFFIDRRQMARAVKAALADAKPEGGPAGGRHTRKGRGEAEAGRRSGVAVERCNRRGFRRPAHRVN